MNTNALHAAVAARTLVALGVRVAVISPGSRNTPLTAAFVAEPGLACTPVLDERTAAFFALGHAKATGEPAVLLCTSGTAAANYLPAVVEARASSTPLIVLSADRPAEMRECASGQAIDQVKLFGHYPVWQAELATPSPRAADTLAHWRQSFVHAVERALDARGPVHLNLPLRDPLAPHENQPGCEAPAGFDLAAFCAHRRPVEAVPSDNTLCDIAFWTKFNAPKETHERGLIVVGACGHGRRGPEAFARGVLALAAYTGYPVLADSLGPVRGAPGANAYVIAGYDMILRSDEAAAALRPSVVIRIGQPPTGKTLRRRLAEWDCPTLVVSASGANLDPLHRRSSTLRTSPELWDTDGFATKPPSAYAEMWADADAGVGLDLDSALEAEGALREPHVTALLARRLPAGTPLFVANSMPVRDTEAFLPRGSRAHPVFHNRGANGIDGTLGTALGVAAALGRPCALLTGDLSLLHDTNALLLASRLKTTLTVILVNNDGGGIFNHLAVSATPAFEEFWATPQTVDFQKLAGAYAGVSHTLVADKESLGRELSAEPGSPGVRILEVRTERAGDADFRRRLFARFA